MSQENAEIVRRSLDAWSRDDIVGWLERAHPDLEFHTSGLYPGIDPVYRGHAELNRFWTTFREPWESIEVRIHEFREVGEEVVALGTFKARARDGMTVEREAAWVYRIEAGLIVRVDAFGSGSEALEAVGLRE